MYTDRDEHAKFWEYHEKHMLNCVIERCKKKLMLYLMCNIYNC